MQPLLILLVEDNPINLSICVAMLKSLGADVETAQNAAEAKEKLTNGRAYAMLMLDIQLPDGDGVAVANEYMAMGGRAPILFLSSPDHAEKCGTYDHLRSEFLAKPFTLRQLQEAIDSLL